MTKTHWIVAAIAAALMFILGFLTGKAVYDRPIGEKVERDTVIVTDTIARYYPKPVEVTKTKTEYKWLTRVTTDTVTRWSVQHDSVLVEVPITSKHYNAPEYDAWVSGFEPSLDSIKVYKETQYITETITRTVKDNKHFFLDVGAGCEYQFNGKTAVPFAELGARLKFGRVGIGAYGGYAHDLKENKASPQARIKVSYDILGF